MISYALAFRFATWRQELIDAFLKAPVSGKYRALKRRPVAVVSLFNPGSVGYARNVWMRNAGIFGNLTKEVLAVDGLQAPPKERR
ncbi:MAG: hypothetical protein WA989_01170, partial [Henriciella sp.]